MLVAWLLAIAVGAVLGYSIAQRTARVYWENRIKQEQALLQTELNGCKQMVLQLRQENADMRYQVGESDKSRRAMEKRLHDQGAAE